MKAAYLLFALALGAIASNAADVAAPAASTPAGTDAQLAFILDNPLKESDYSASDRCLHSRTYRTVEILDRRHLLFIGMRDDLWLNQLRADCVGLRRDSVLIFETQQDGVCDLDSFRGVPRNASMNGDFGAHCTLGHFERITPEQAGQLRIALAK
jgi:hypothetical protein